jgi:transposase
MMRTRVRLRVAIPLSTAKDLISQRADEFDHQAITHNAAWLARHWATAKASRCEPRGRSRHPRRCLPRTTTSQCPHSPRAARGCIAESKADHGSEFEATQTVAPKLGNSSAETMCKSVRRAESDVGQRPETTTEDSEKNKALKKDNAELLRTNKILKSTAAYFGAELERPHRVVVDFISQQREGFGGRADLHRAVRAGCPVAPSTYDNLTRRPSRRRCAVRTSSGWSSPNARQ